MPSREVLRLFKQDLWKDRRVLQKVDTPAGAQLVKDCSSSFDAQREAELLSKLAEALGPGRVPEVLEVSGSQVKLAYLSGIRVFNLLVELDGITGPLLEPALALKEQLIERCERNQQMLQKALVRVRSEVRAPYAFATKLVSLVRMFVELLDIHVDEGALVAEIERAGALWTPQVCVPFRDANPKNMALVDPELSLRSFAGEEGRSTFIADCVRSGRAARWAEIPIVDFDFSSCDELTTPEDDVVSFKYHDRTWRGAPRSAEDVVWGYPPSPSRCALTFVLRYYRYGGRRAIYRLVHSSAHRVRHRHDLDRFCFERLLDIVKTIWPEGQATIPRLLAFTEVVARKLPDDRPGTDYFLASELFEPRPLYTDMFPD